MHIVCVVYTLGPALRIPHVKNMGKDLALEELRICPWHARRAKNVGRAKIPVFLMPGQERT